MVRKLIVVATIAIMLFGVTGLTACTPEEKPTGKFYSLEEAYDEGWLTQTDLKNLAFYYRGTTFENFTASPKKPAELTADTQRKVKRLYLEYLKKSVPKATLADISIAGYYGTYGECVAVKVWDDCIDYDLKFIPEKIIGGVVFFDYCGREIFIYKIEN